MAEKRNLRKINVKKDQPNEQMGNELGAVITNKQKNYPTTGDWKIEIPVVDRGKCIGCGACARNCPEATIVMGGDGKKRPAVQYEYCKGCGVCARACPVEAISMKLRSKKN